MVVNAVNTLSITRTDPSSPATCSPSRQRRHPRPQRSGAARSSRWRVPPAVSSPLRRCGNARRVRPRQPDRLHHRRQSVVGVLDQFGLDQHHSATSAGTPVTDVAVTVPAVGAYFAGPTTTARSYCAVSSPTTPTQRGQCLLSAGRQLPGNHRPPRRNQRWHACDRRQRDASANPERSAGQYSCGNMNGATVSVAALTAR